MEEVEEKDVEGVSNGAEKDRSDESSATWGFESDASSVVAGHRDESAVSCSLPEENGRRIQVCQIRLYRGEKDKIEEKPD